jgi:acyl-CoA synthetase (AMP-forming)/AMP-acid ligase II
MLAETALRQPQRQAIVDGDAVADYEGLAGRVAGVAESLPSLGVVPGDRVAIMLRRGTDAAASYFGILAAGGVAVVVNEQLRPRQIEHTPASRDDFPFVEGLARDGVLVLPAPVFHHKGHFRLALTGSPEMLERALPVLGRHAGG